MPVSPVPTDEGEEADKRSGSYVHVIATYVSPILTPPHSREDCSRNWQPHKRGRTREAQGWYFHKKVMWWPSQRRR